MADDFLTTYAPLANDVATQTGVDPSVVLGIIDTETGHGAHVLGNNIFGITPPGGVARYPDVQTAAQAFVGLMQTPRYAGVAAAPDSASQAAALVKSGYNTVNPKYAATVTSNAQNAAKQLGYQDDGGSGSSDASAQPGQPQPTPEVGKALADPALQPSTPPTPSGQPSTAPVSSAAPGQAPSSTPAPQTEVDKAVADPALQPSGKPPATPSGTADPDLPITSEYGDIGPNAWFNKSATPPPPADNAITRIADAAVAGAQGTQPILTPAGNLLLGPEDSPLGKINRWGFGLVDTARAGVNALSAGALHAVYEAGTAIGGPALGRDLATMLMVAPAADMPGFSEARRPLSTEPPPARPEPGAGWTPPPNYAPMDEINPLDPATADRAKAQAGPASPVPEAGLGAVQAEPAPGLGTAPPTEAGASPQGAPAGPLPAAAGAQATSEPIPLKTPGQALRDLQSSVNQTAEDRAGPQLNDDTAYVPGIPPRPLASREFTPTNSLDEKIARTDPAFRTDIEAIERERNGGMVDLLHSDAGDDIALEKAHETRSEVSPVALGVFEGEKPVDASGLVSSIDDVLNGPAGKRAAVSSTLNSVRASLFDSDGNLETLPSQLYGARQNITDMLKKGVRGSGDVADNVRASKSILQGLLPDFDTTITGGAPKFTDYLQQFSDLSKPIDRMEFLQQYMTGPRKITDQTGYLIPSKVQKMLDDIYQGQRAPGVNKAKSLTPDEIGNVINVRNELATQQLRDRMAATRGSDTFQQIQQAGMLGQGPVGAAVKRAADLATHGILGATTGGAGNMLYQFGVKPMVAARRAKADAAAIAARKDELLGRQAPAAPSQGPTPNPNPAGQFVPPAMRNPLQPPP